MDLVAAERLKVPVWGVEDEPLLWRNRALLAMAVENEVKPVLMKRAQLRARFANGG